MQTLEAKNAFLLKEIARLTRALEKREKTAAERKRELDKAKRALEKQEQKHAKELAKRDAELAKKDQQNAAELAKRDQKIDDLERSCAAKDQIIGVQANMLARAAEWLKNEPKDIPEATQDIIKRLLEASACDIALASGKQGQALLKAILARGTENVSSLFKTLDKGGQTSEEQYAKAAAEMRGIAETEKKAETTLDLVTEIQRDEAAKPGNEDREQLQSAARIANAPDPEKKPEAARKPKVKPKEGMKTAGRQVPDSKANCSDFFESSFLADGVCPCCGKKGKLTAVATVSHFLRYMLMAISDLLREGTFSSHAVHCGHCNKVFSDRPPEMPVPYSPTASCQASSDVVITMAMLQATGTPDNRIERMLGANRLQAATERFARPVSTWAASGGIGGILLGKHEDEAKKAEYIGADETKFPVLEQEDEPGTPHLLVRTSTPFAQEQFAIFTVLSSRSGDAISHALEGWNFIGLNTDAYQGYDTAISKLIESAGKEVPIARQDCLLHARRKILAALDLKSLQALVAQKDGRELIREGIISGQDQYVLCAIVEALRKVYRWESTLMPMPDETLEAHRTRVKETRSRHIRQLMDDAYKQIDSLKDKHAEYKKGRWIAKNGSETARAVVYWLNNRDRLTTFLENPNIAPDSNNVERTIRAAALFKNNAFFKRNMEGAETFCRVLSLRETAKLNGIEDPIKWLTAFHRAFYEHVERMVWTDRYQGLAPGEPLPVRIQQIPQSVIDSFDFTPWLAWNYAAREGRSE